MKYIYLKCPYCDSEIQDGALKCRYCKEDINQVSMLDKPKRSLKKYVFLGVIIFLIMGLFNIFLKNQFYGKNPHYINDLDQFEHVKLKSYCLDKATEFAKARSDSEFAKWIALRSDYNQKEQSCFGEFMELVNRYDGSSHVEYWIFDLLTKKYVDSYLYEERDSTGRVYQNYDTEYKASKTKYENTSKDIFGSVYPQK